jgi:hypothetical protein
VQIAAGTFDAQTASGERVQMTAAGDEDDIVAGGGKLRAKVAADCASAHHGDTHVDFLTGYEL